MEWITWSRMPRFPQTKGDNITREANRGNPTGFTLQRPATDEEIAAELAKRAELETSAKLRADFEARADYQAAIEIRNTLEFMTRENHPLDKLSPAEWASLRQRLCS